MMLFFIQHFEEGWLMKQGHEWVDFGKIQHDQVMQKAVVGVNVAGL